MSEEADEIRWMTVEEASKYLRVTKTTLYAYMKDKRLPFYYIVGTRNRRLKKSDVDALLIIGQPDELDAEDDASE